MNKYLPKIYQKDIFSINYDKLKNMNIKCLLFDLDNTISPAREKVLDKKVKKLFDELKKDFKIILFSNNKPKRVKFFSDYYNVDYTFFSLKPLSFSYSYVLRKYKFKNKEVAAIGDQIMTDIKGGNKKGLITILVDPISDLDGKSTFINRKIEKIVLKNFEKKDIFKKGRYYD